MLPISIGRRLAEHRGAHDPQGGRPGRTRECCARLPFLPPAQRNRRKATREMIPSAPPPRAPVSLRFSLPFLQNRLGQLGQLGHSPETSMVKRNPLYDLCRWHWDTTGTHWDTRSHNVAGRRIIRPLRRDFLARSVRLRVPLRPRSDTPICPGRAAGRGQSARVRKPRSGAECPASGYSCGSP